MFFFRWCLHFWWRDSVQLADGFAPGRAYDSVWATAFDVKIYFITVQFEIGFAQQQ